VPLGGEKDVASLAIRAKPVEVGEPTSDGEEDIASMAISDKGPEARREKAKV
jgi:hypothetical protein